MEEKKEFKISLGAVVAIGIVILVAVISMIVFMLKYQESAEPKNEVNEVNQVDIKENTDKIINNEIEENNIIQKPSNSINTEDDVEKTNNVASTENKSENKSEKVQEKINNIVSKLSKNDTHFVIEKIEKKNEKFSVTVNILNNKAKELSQNEFNKILNGGTLKFRGLEWKKTNSPAETDDYIYVRSGEYMLAISYDRETNAYCIENVAGAKTGGLADYSGETIKFEIENIEDDILNQYNRSKDAYSECKAIVSNGKITGIEFLLSNNR